MDRHLRLAFIFKDTMQQLSANKKLRKAMEEVKSKAKFYDAKSKLVIEILQPELTLQASARLRRQIDWYTNALVKWPY